MNEAEKTKRKENGRPRKALSQECQEGAEENQCKQLKKCGKDCWIRHTEARRKLSRAIFSN